MAKHAKHARTDESLDQMTNVQDAEESIVDCSEETQDCAEGGKDVAIPAEPINVSVAASKKMGNHAKVKKPKEHPHHIKSRRMRIALTVVSVILVLLLAALGYFAVRLYNEASGIADQTASQVQTEDLKGQATESTQSEIPAFSTPQLSHLIGMTEDEIIDEVGRGAAETSKKDITKEVKEGKKKKAKTVVVGSHVTLTLAEEQSDASGNTPSVYVTLDEDGKAVSLGYSTSVGSLGYGNMSFADVVQSGYIVERLVSNAGIPTDDGSVALPAASKYRTFADDGVTIAQEQYKFTGKGKSTSGKKLPWTCQLTYDYSAANVSGNLADTIKTVYLTVGE